jgi:hypothetical protein
MPNGYRKPLRLAIVLLIIALAGTLRAEPLESSSLPDNCERLLQTLDSLGAPLPEASTKGLKAVLAAGANDSQAVEKIQQLLDPHCLINININPESRVKAARGPAKAELVHDAWASVLVKIQNDGGVTAGLRVGGLQIRSAAVNDESRWLEAEFYTKKPMTARLSGASVEYAILRLRSREAGKREATLQFDVGQGTQDLGFRAEVPILFTIR